jgi:hypothetical protein
VLWITELRAGFCPPWICRREGKLAIVGRPILLLCARMSSAGVHFGQSVCARGQDRTRDRRPLRLSILGSLFVASFELQSTKRTLCDLVPQRAAKAWWLTAVIEPSWSWRSRGVWVPRPGTSRLSGDRVAEDVSGIVDAECACPPRTDIYTAGKSIQSYRFERYIGGGGRPPTGRRRKECKTRTLSSCQSVSAAGVREILRTPFAKPSSDRLTVALPFKPVVRHVPLTREQPYIK